MILLTGATGKVGSAAAAALADNGTPVRVFVRDPSKLTVTESAGVDVVGGDLCNVEDIRRALDGITKALLVTANSERQSQIERQFAECAADAGVDHLVKISSMEASANAGSAIPQLHYESEQHLKSLGPDWTLLRPNFFMQNLLMYSMSISKAGVFALPFGDAKTGMIDVRDVGLAIAAVFADDRHRNKTYELTGAELLDFHDVAERMSTGLGRDVRYLDQPPEEFRAFLAQFIPSAWHVDAVCSLFAQIADRALDKLSPDYTSITARPATAIERFIHDFAPSFR